MAKFEYMERAFSSELRPRARLVLQVLVLHCNKEGECFPSIKTIAAKCGYGISTVKRALDELVEAGYIIKQARFDKRKNGGQTSNLYTLCVEEPQRPTESGLYLPDEKTYGTESGCLPVTEVSRLPSLRSSHTPLSTGLKQHPSGRNAARMLCGLGGSPFLYPLEPYK